MTHTPALVDFKAYAQSINKHPETVRRWIVTGQVPAYKSGRSWMVDPAEVREAQRFTPPARVARPNVPGPGLTPRPATPPARVPATVAEALAELDGAAA